MSLAEDLTHILGDFPNDFVHMLHHAGKILNGFQAAGQQHTPTVIGLADMVSVSRFALSVPGTTSSSSSFLVSSSLRRTPAVAKATSSARGPPKSLSFLEDLDEDGRKLMRRGPEVDGAFAGGQEYDVPGRGPTKDMSFTEGQPFGNAQGPPASQTSQLGAQGQYVTQRKFFQGCILRIAAPHPKR